MAMNKIHNLTRRVEKLLTETWYAPLSVTCIVCPPPPHTSRAVLLLLNGCVFWLVQLQPEPRVCVSLVELSLSEAPWGQILRSDKQEDSKTVSHILKI